VDVLVGPIHFGNVHQTFHAFFDFGEAAVIGQVGDAGAGDGCPSGNLDMIATHGSSPSCFRPRETRLRSRSNFRTLTSDFVANVDDFARMLDALPGHVGDVQQTVDAAQVNECTVVGQVLDDALDHLAFLQGFQQASRSAAVFGFHHGATGNHNVVALLDPA
jgi:hypothetical protein